MGKFHDTLDEFGNTVELPDDFRSAIAAAYDEDFQGANAKVDQLTGDLTQKDSTINDLKTGYESEISSLKSANYDLLRAVPRDANVESRGDNNDTDNHGSDADILIDDLFGN